MASFEETVFRTLRRVGILLLVVVGMTVVGCTTTTRIDAGHVGIRVKLAGTARGVQDMEIKTGWTFYNPVTEQIVIFPTSVQNVVWTQSAHEGRPVDESITFSSSEGVNVNADIGLSFHIRPDLAPKLYARFRQNDMQILAYGYVRNVVRENFNEVASRMPVQEIYGAGKSKMLSDVVEKCRKIFADDGIEIDQLTINGALRLPPNVSDAINRAMEATQNAIQSENRVRQVKAEAEQAVAQAHGQAEATRQKAQGEADGLLIRARSEAMANEIIRLSMTPAVLQYRTVERWDGKLPAYNGGTLPMLTVDAAKLTSGLDEATREKRLKELLDEKGAAPAAPATPTPAPAAPTPAPAPVPAKPAAPAPMSSAR